jgi:hypothetical protein
MPVEGALTPEEEAEIIGRHRTAFNKLQPMSSREFRYFFKASDTPLRVSASEIQVEGLVAWRGMGAVLLVGAVEVEHASRGEHTSYSGRPSLSCQG